MVKLMFAIHVILAAGAVAGCGSPLPDAASSSPAEGRLAEAGRLAPAFSLESVLQVPPGAQADLAALKGKVVVLEFWATSCGQSIMAISHLNDLAEQFADRPVQFVFITDQKEEIVQESLKKRPIRGWVGLDTDRSMYHPYGVSRPPHTVLIDKSGNVVGFPNAAGVTADVLNDLLAGRTPNLPKLVLYRRLVPPSETQEQPRHPIYEVSIRPSNHEPDKGVCTISRGYRKLDGLTLMPIINAGLDISRTRVLAAAELPTGIYDVLVQAPDERDDTACRLLREALEMTFGLSCAMENREMDAYHLKITSGGLKDGLEPTGPPGRSSAGGGPKNLRAEKGTPATLARMLEDRMKVPIVDQSGLKDYYNFELVVESWEEADVNNALRTQLGLELVPVRDLVEVLVIKRRE